MFVVLTPLKESQDGAPLESAHFELQDDKYLVNVHFYTAKPSLSHGDLVFDPRSDLSQGRGDDAEHPTIIPMYTRAYGITKVNSLLSESSLSACKTWMLLQARTLFILRYT